MKSQIISINAETLADLQVKTIGYNHDHARAVYFGSMKDIPFKYMKYFDETSRYCAVIEEQIPQKQ